MQLDVKECLRYLGADENLRPQVEAAAGRLSAALAPRWTYRVLPWPLQELDLPGETARTMLSQCRQVCVLVCTLGAQFDAMLRAEEARGMDRAVIWNACGSAWVEAGCDEAQREIAARFPQLYLTDRFSPGYGDLPLSVQPALCALTDAQRRLGVTVTPSHLLNPVKTVTALIGLSDSPQRARIRGCAYCAMRDTCSIRKGGKRCAL